MATKSKKMSNEGHNAKVPYGKTIGFVFLLGMIVGCAVVFLAVAGRTHNIVLERRALLKEKNEKAAAAVVKPSDTEPEAVEAPKEIPAPLESSSNTLP
jgi:hypothetical protein